jgi:hypothetical protein
MMWYQTPAEIQIPDSVTSSHVSMPLKLNVDLEGAPQLSGVISPTHDDHVLLLEHWSRMATQASRTAKFSMWAKFDATVIIQDGVLMYKGCWCVKNPQGKFLLKADCWQKA